MIAISIFQKFLKNLRIGKIIQKVTKYYIESCLNLISLKVAHDFSISNSYATYLADTKRRCR